MLFTSYKLDLFFIFQFICFSSLTSVVLNDCTVPTIPKRNFRIEEVRGRVEAIQYLMEKHEIDSVVISDEPEFRYFSSFNSPFWVSKTRPWFLIIPSHGTPTALIPEIGKVDFLKQSWIGESNVISWPSPRKEDDGISDLLRELSTYERIGLALGHESRIGFPGGDFLYFYDEMKKMGVDVVDCQSFFPKLMNIKSQSEIEKMKYISQITSEAFQNLCFLYEKGDSERDLSRKFKIDLLQRGADDIPYISVSSGPDGYRDITSHPTDRILEDGDVFFMDIGAVFDGYYSDFNRQFFVGESASEETKIAYELVFQATQSAIDMAKPGVSLGELWEVMSRTMEGKDGLLGGGNTGRLGHGVGLRITEGFSVKKDETLVLEEGMVIAIEPGSFYRNKFGEKVLMVHEENVVITKTGCELLSIRSSKEIEGFSSCNIK